MTSFRGATFCLGAFEQDPVQLFFVDVENARIIVANESTAELSRSRWKGLIGCRIANVGSGSTSAFPELPCQGAKTRLAPTPGAPLSYLRVRLCISAGTGLSKSPVSPVEFRLIAPVTGLCVDSCGRTHGTHSCMPGIPPLQDQPHYLLCGLGDGVQRIRSGQLGTSPTVPCFDCWICSESFASRGIAQSNSRSGFEPLSRRYVNGWQGGAALTRNEHPDASTGLNDQAVVPPKLTNGLSGRNNIKHPSNAQDLVDLTCNQVPPNVIGINDEIRGYELERNRIAAELHDSLAFKLAGLIWHLRALTIHAHGTASDTQIISGLEEAETFGQDLARELRRAIWGLSSDVLRGRSLADALESELRKVGRSVGIRAGFSVIGTPRALPAFVEQTAAKICLEAVHNAVEHAECAAVVVELSYESEAMQLRVRDDGQGFTSTLSHSGFGMQNMIDRAHTVGGRVTVDAASGNGTCITVTFPPARHAHAA